MLLLLSQEQQLLLSDITMSVLVAHKASKRFKQDNLWVVTRCFVYLLCCAVSISFCHGLRNDFPLFSVDLLGGGGGGRWQKANNDH